MFFIQPEFKEFLLGNYNRFHPGTVLYILSAIVNAWHAGPAMAGVTLTEFAALRVFLKGLEGEFRKVRQCFYLPSGLLADFEFSVAESLRLLLYAVGDELHKLQGLGGENCRCVQCVATSQLIVRPECPGCGMPLTPSPDADKAHVVHGTLVRLLVSALLPCLEALHLMKYYPLSAWC